VTPTSVVTLVAGAALAVQRALNDDRLGAHLAIAQAHLLFVGRAALGQAGAAHEDAARAAPTPEGGHGACAHPGHVQDP
jgi:hypothetical protein